MLGLATFLTIDEKNGEHGIERYIIYCEIRDSGEIYWIMRFYTDDFPETFEFLSIISAIQKLLDLGVWHISCSRARSKTSCRAGILGGLKGQFSSWGLSQQ